MDTEQTFHYGYNYLTTSTAAGSSTDSLTRRLDHNLNNNMANLTDRSEMGIEALYPAVIECFSVILIGYFAGKSGLVSSVETKGLNTFIGSFSLPALVFISIAQLNLSSVNWPFILGIALGKTAIFVAVLLVSLLVSRQFDKAGLFAIFCSQSNDFALGYPIVLALYGQEYASYIYLLGPVSLVLLNPVGFIFMEISKQRNLEHQQQLQSGGGSLRLVPNSSFVVMKKVLWGIMLNPVVLMTVLGIAGNFIFKHNVPSTLAGILNMLGSAFSAAALFSLGLTMVGSAASLKGAGFVVPGILIAVKLIALPVVSREFVNFLNPGAHPNETLAMSNYAFLYGTLPTAPGVFVFACQYEIYVEMIAGAMVACTFLSAPLMFLAAKMTSLRDLDPADYIHQFDKFLMNVSFVGLFASIWVIGIFILSKKWRKVPHCITLCLCVSQAIGCVGALVWCFFGVELNGTPALFVQFFIFSFGVLSSRVWTAILASSLVFLRCRSFCFVLRMRPWMVLIGWGVPAGLTTMLLLTVKRESLDEKQNPNFQYGESQAMVAAMVLVICFIVTIGCLVMQQRYERRYAQYRALRSVPPNSDLSPVIEDGEEDEEGLLDTATTQQDDEEVAGGSMPRRGSGTAESKSSHHQSRCSSINCGTCPKLRVCKTATQVASTPGRQRKISEIEDLINSDGEEDDQCDLFNHSGDLCSPSKHPCDAVQRKHCRALLERYRALNVLTEPEEIGIVRDRDDEFQMLRHIVLLLLLSISMFVGLALCLWTLIMEDLSGIYVELVFLDAALNFGQGFLTFILFGLNTKMVVMPLQKRWRRLVHGGGILQLPEWEELPADTKHVCEQFLSYHFDKCVKDIVRDRRWRMESYTKVFCGNELVDWLLLVGLARDRSEGVKYGKHLLNGRVIRHVKEIHHFHDQPFFYTFLPAGTIAVTTE